MKRGGIIFQKKNYKGQVWIETVIYTLIAFVMIGLVLSYAKPKIEEFQDKTILQQSTDMMRKIDSTILTMGATGNRRKLEIGIKKGELKIDGFNDKIIFEMESKNLYSEPGEIVNDGEVIVLTQRKSGYYNVTLTLSYVGEENIRFEGKDEMKVISKASTPYNLIIKNEGKGTDGRLILNMSIK